MSIQHIRNKQQKITTTMENSDDKTKYYFAKFLQLVKDAEYSERISSIPLKKKKGEEEQHIPLSMTRWNDYHRLLDLFNVKTIEQSKIFYDCFCDVHKKRSRCFSKK